MSETNRAEGFESGTTRERLCEPWGGTVNGDSADRVGAGHGSYFPQNSLLCLPQLTRRPSRTLVALTWQILVLMMNASPAIIRS